MTRGSQDLFFHNGHILTMNPASPMANRMLVHDGRISAVGDQLPDGVPEAAKTIDLKGATVVPGFIDAHVHFLWGGESLLAIPADQARSKSQFIQLVRQGTRGRPAGSWLRGGGWNEHLFTDGQYPHKNWLDVAAPGYPMILTRHDGHSGIASSAALEIAGIDRSTPDPQGGVIDRDEQGEPTGILRDAAMSLVMHHLPPESEDDLQRQLTTAQNYLLERGVTSVADMIYDLNHLRFLEKMAREKRLKIRVTAYLPLLKWPELKAQFQSGFFHNEWFQVKGLKGFCDGSLGSHTALMLAPYDDTPDASGIYDKDWSDVVRVREILAEADTLGLQAVIHAIGDRAVREVLDLFEAVMQMNPPRDRRFRIEHAQHIHPDDQPRFAALGVIPSVQPAHCLDDSLYAERLLGDRCSYAYPFQSLWETGASLPLGSDWPVSPADPLATIRAAVLRAHWHSEEALRLEQALEGHTQLSARAAFREQDLGSLKAGKLADFVILAPNALDHHDLRGLSRESIHSVYIHGEEVYSQPT